MSIDDAMTLTEEYCKRITTMLKELVISQRDKLALAQSWIADALEQSGLVYVTGSGHSHMIAEEVFYRAGGAAAVQAVLDPGLMLHQGAHRATALERLDGYARVVLQEYPIGPKDIVLIASNSGRNAFPIEAALFAREQGAKTIAITSSDHAAHVTSRHKSGRMLHEVTDLVIDNHAPYGDACLVIPGCDKRMGSTSTISGAFIVNVLMVEAVANLSRRGTDVDIYRSANAGGDGANAEEIVKRWRTRIRGL